MNMKKGFTLVEIMIVVAIIAILAAVAIPNFIGYRLSAQRGSCIANLKQLDSATEAYRVNQNDPTAIPDMDKLYNKTGTGLLKGTAALTCPGGGTYSKPKSTTDGWTCSLSTDADYPHTNEKKSTK